MTSSATGDATRAEWRKLGFFYELDTDLQQWRLVGSRAGLLGFRDVVLDYAAAPEHATASSRAHVGPRAQLAMITWSDPGIEADGISGSLDDFRHLASLVERKLSGAQPGDRVRIGRDYAPASDYVLALDLREDGFDPSSMDRMLRTDA
ncbi:MAG TPA: hypothetical protein VFG89_02260 [Coriobacteriia bacterium]|nr:hypothetical protein [Coriobacteriia bacterium]